ncbi:MAG: hypothetical protein ACP5N7_06255, partial [Candidatus Pacearchaeota archaeon]
MRKLGKKKQDFTSIFGTTKNAIKSDLFDENAYKKAVGDKLLKLEKEGKTEYEQFPELLQDVFSSLYKYVPELNPELAMKKDFAMNHALIQKILEHPKWKELRVYTKLDNVTSSIGTEFFGEELREMVKKMKDQQAAMKAMQDAADNLAAAGGDSDGEEGEEGENANPGHSGKSKEQIELEEAKKKFEEAKKNFKDSMNDKTLRQNLSNMMKLVQDKVTETQELIQNWGLENDPTYANSDYKDKMDLVNQLRNSDKLKRIAELAGRFKAIALSVQREKVKRGIDEIYSIAPGNNLDRTLPSELISLTDPNLEMDFYKRFIEGNLLNYTLSGREKKKRGPIIICLDSSGSMSGMAEIWSKAVAIALLEVARVQKRDFCGIHFSGEHSPARLKTHEFLKRDPFSIKKLIDFCSYYEGGGTNFEAPLARAQ